MFEEKILKGVLGMVSPDAEVAGKGTILITSDAEERDEAMLEKPLSDFLADGAALSCDDFLQNFSVKVYVWHTEDPLEEGKEFLFAGDKDKLQPKAEEETKEEEPKKDEANNGSSSDQCIDVDDDIVEISNGATNGAGDKKRPHDEECGNGTAKKQK